ncbi:MAG TPA: glycosyltransferase family 4 protein [Flavitalea sp.]|nr:glycosyltransferase family 4 protein [Flavitalea sp.]
MKVLHLIQRSQLRGAEIFASQLASHINRSGNTAVIVSLFPGNADLPFNGNIIPLNGNSKGRLHDIKAWKKLAKIIKDEKPDVIQANAGDTLKYAVFSKILYRWKQPIVFRNASTISLYIKTWSQRMWNSFLFHFVHKIISVSNTSALDFSKLFPAYKTKVITIPIGIEHLEISRSMNGKAPERVQLNGQGPRIVHVGGFTFEKNHTGLLEIFHLVLSKEPAASLYLVGDGPLKQKMEGDARAKGLGSNVKFCGFQTNAMEYIRGADVLVLPSIIEGLPGVLLEAFYCKIPVVAYDVGGIKEIVKNNKTGRLIPKGDIQAFAEAILEALQKTDKNQRLIDNAYELVMSNYLNTQIANQFISVYKSLSS